jgi:formylglycine-generating enzyme required for sulfatase activity
VDAAVAAWDMALVTTRDPSAKLALLYQLHGVLVLARKWHQVIETTEEALEIVPGDETWLDLKLQALLQSATSSEVLQFLRVLTAQQRVTEQWWFERAKIAYDLGLHEEVRLSLDAARTMYPASDLIARACRDYLPPISFDRFPQRLRELGFEGRNLGGVEIITPPMCTIPSGSFWMGEGQDPEHLAHEVIVSEFRIAKFPVTVAEFACAVRSGAVPEPLPIGNHTWRDQLKCLDTPVVGITWQDTQAYAAWLSRVTEQPWRLPTEAEWEKAARGTDRRLYPWGNQWEPGRANTIESEIGGITPVGSYPSGASPYAVQDLSGNVWEWTTSLYAPYPYSHDREHEDPSSAASRVLRGGSWHGNARNATVTYRLLDVDFRNIYAGFRLVCAI